MSFVPVSAGATDDLAAIVGEPETLVVKDRTYRVYPLTLEDQAELQTFINRSIPDPMDILQEQLAKHTFAPEVREQMIKEAMAAAFRGKPLLGTPQASAVLNTVPGLTFIFWLSIRKGDPSFTQQQAAAVLRELEQETRDQVLETADIMGHPGPKARAGTSSSRTGSRGMRQGKRAKASGQNRSTSERSSESSPSDTDGARSASGS